MPSSDASGTGSADEIEANEIPVEQPPPQAAPAPNVNLSHEQFAMLIQAFTQAPQHVNNDGLSMEAKTLALLRKSLVETFDGSSLDPAAAELWMYQLEAGFSEINCPERLKAHCGACMLKGEARYWWDSVARSLNPIDGVITWQMFKTKFFDKYYPKAARYQLKKQFTSLVQGSMSVAEYERQFDRLSRFAPEFVDTDEKKLEAFIMGLEKELQGEVESHFPADYASALSIALLVDKTELRRIQQQASRGQSSGHKRKADQVEEHQEQQTNPRQQQENRNKQRRPPPQGYTYPLCPTCNKHHQGECTWRRCFECGQGGHIAMYCPTKAVPVNQRQAPREILPPPPRPAP